MSAYLLVALDLGGVVCTNDELQVRLVRAGAVSGASMTTREIPDPRHGAEPGATVREHRYTLDSRELRNTSAHSIGYHAGYVVHNAEA